MFQVLNAKKVKLCCVVQGTWTDTFNLEIHHDGLSGRSDFLILKLTQNRHTMVASMANCWNNLDLCTRYEPDLLKFLNL